MAGPEEPGPGAEPDGLIRKRFSADGTHLIFGSTSLFAAGGNDETGDVSIYDRNLTTGQTQVVSNDTSGDPLDCLQGAGQCHSPGEHGRDRRARRVQRRLADRRRPAGRHRRGRQPVLPPLHARRHRPGDDRPDARAPPTGALYDGMTEDGSTVYFTTRDPLTTTANQDTDSSADIFRADVAVRRRDPHPGLGRHRRRRQHRFLRPGRERHQRTLERRRRRPADCSAVAIGGGGGVASRVGDDLLPQPRAARRRRQRHADAPNLYVDEPGSGPHFVATLESSLTAPDPPNEYHPYDHSFGSCPESAVRRRRRLGRAIRRRHLRRRQRHRTWSASTTPPAI